LKTGYYELGYWQFKVPLKTKVDSGMGMAAPPASFISLAKEPIRLS
jgi:hypothetical protein